MHEHGIAHSSLNKAFSGRIAGQEGKTKFTIENASRTRIVLADTWVPFLLLFSPDSITDTSCTQENSHHGLLPKYQNCARCSCFLNFGLATRQSICWTEDCEQPYEAASPVATDRRFIHALSLFPFSRIKGTSPYHDAGYNMRRNIIECHVFALQKRSDHEITARRRIYSALFCQRCPTQPDIKASPLPTVPPSYNSYSLDRSHDLTEKNAYLLPCHYCCFHL